MNAFIRSPLLHFLIAGGLLYGIYARLKAPPREELVISTVAAESVERRLVKQLGHSPTPVEFSSALQGYAEKEVLILEAIRRGYDRDDPMIRQQLTDLMLSTLEETPPVPSRTQLEAYFQENMDRYRVGDLLDFEQVFFVSKSPKMPRDSSALLSALRQGADIRPIGDPVSHDKTLKNQSRSALRRSLGGAFSEGVFRAEINRWFGPVRSWRGQHFVKITSRHASPDPVFQVLEKKVESDWQADYKRQAKARQVAELRARYRVMLDGKEILFDQDATP